MSKSKNEKVRRNMEFLKNHEGCHEAKIIVYKMAYKQAMHYFVYNYSDRNKLDRNMSFLCFSPINVVVILEGIIYSNFTYPLKVEKIVINRKIILKTIIADKKSFLLPCDKVKHNLFLDTLPYNHFPLGVDGEHYPIGVEDDKKPANGGNQQMEYDVSSALYTFSSLNYKKNAIF